MKNIRIFNVKNCHFLVVKFSVCLNRRVFVMRYGKNGFIILFLVFSCLFLCRALSFLLLQGICLFFKKEKAKTSSTFFKTKM